MVASLKASRVVEPKSTSKGEEQVLVNLRAQAWGEFVGQERVKEALALTIQAAKQRNEPMEHTLLFGPPGLGKTTLAHLIAKEMGVHIRITSGPAIERVGDMAAILTNLGEKDILFIDEIHRLRKQIEEILYPAMEDGKLDIILGKGPGARTVRLKLKPFTVVGATTRMSLVAAPLRDRFGIVQQLSFYTPDELVVVVKNAAKKLAVTISGEGALLLAQRSRRTARVALRLLKRVRDLAQVQGKKTIEGTTVEEALALLAVDRVGLDETDRKLLTVLISNFSGGPAGLSTLAASLGEDAATIEEVYEPFLLQMGYIKRTAAGRVATKRAYEHLGKKKIDKK